MFDNELLKRFRYLELLAEQAGGRSLLDAPREKIPGGGTEVTGVRDYAAGDEYRYVDWTWCGRRDELLTKVFESNADLHYYSFGLFGRTQAIVAKVLNNKGSIRAANPRNGNGNVADVNAAHYRMAANTLEKGMTTMINPCGSRDTGA